MKNIGITAALLLAAPLAITQVQAQPTAASEQIITRHTFRDVASKVTPAVVNIKIKSNIVLGRGRTSLPHGMGLDKQMREYLEELLERESGLMSPRAGEEYKYSRSGSGVIINNDGYLITSNHVIENVDENDIEISLPDGRSFSSISLIGTDSLTDLAVLRINDEGTSSLPHLEWGDSDSLHVGDHVLAVGNPLDFTNSVSQGIVSAKHRTLNSALIEDLIQTTAMINPGNSGGALVDLDGKLVGINMAIATSTGMWNGLSFSIPSNTAKTISEQIISRGKALRGYLGIQMKSLESGFARYVGYKKDYGIVVEDVTPGTAAEKAGIQQADIISAVNGNKISSHSDMHRNIGNLPVGTKVELEVWRDVGESTIKELQIPVILGERPDDRTLRADERPNARRPQLPGSKPEENTLGLELEPRPSGEGLLVKSVKSGSPLDKTGISEGDIILSVNRQEIKTLEDFKKALKSGPNTGTHLFSIERNGNRLLELVPGN